MQPVLNKIIVKSALATIILIAGFFLLIAVPGQARAQEPLIGFQYSLELGGNPVGYFVYVSNLGSENEVVEHIVINQDTGIETIQKIPGRLVWLDVTLRRGITASMDMWDWRQQVVDGDMASARKNCSIVARDQSMAEVARWDLVNAWPSKISAPATTEVSEDYMIEEITLVHEGVIRQN